MAVDLENNAFARLSAFSRSANVGVLLFNSSAALEFANTLACDLLKCSDEKELNARWPSIKKSLFSEDLSAATAAIPFRTCLKISGDTSLFVEAYALHEEGGRKYLLLLRDQRVGETLDADLLLASRMRSLIHLHGAQEHDVRAPLNAMQITLELLAETVADGATTPPAENGEARQQRYVRVLREELSRLKRAMQPLLDQKAPFSEKPEAFDVRDIIREIVNFIGPQVRRQRVDLEIQTTEQPMRLEGYRDRLKQALLDIAINRLQSMPKGGDLTIGATARNAKALIVFQLSNVETPNGLARDGIRSATAETDDYGLQLARTVIESFGGEMATNGRDSGGVSITVALPIVMS